MISIENGSLWRCNQCHYSIYQVANVEDSTVYYRHRNDDSGENRLMTMNVGLWLITHEPLPTDNAGTE